MSPIAHDHPSDLDFPSSKRLKIIHNLPAASMPVTLADLEDTTMVSAPDTPAASGVDDNNNTDRMNSDADGAAMGGGHAAAVASAQGAAFGDLDAELHGEHTHSTQSANNNFSASQPATASAASNGAAVIPLQIKRLTPSATVPTRGSAFAAGYDLYASEDSVVPGRGKAMVATGIAIAVPPQTYGRVAPRSGLAAKHSIATGAGVIDYDYRGEVKVILFNHSDADFKISVGDRIAQLVLERIVTPDVVEVEELEETVRGEGGLGVQGGLGGWLGMGEWEWKWACGCRGGGISGYAAGICCVRF